MKRGQITLVNFLALFITFLLYLALMPVLTPIIDSTVASISVTPNQYTPIIAAMMYLIPAFILLFLVLTGLNYAIPQQQQGY